MGRGAGAVRCASRGALATHVHFLSHHAPDSPLRLRRSDRKVVRSTRRDTEVPPVHDPRRIPRQGHRLIDWIADYRATLADRPVMARTEPGEIRAAAARRRLPKQPEGFEAIVRDLDAILVPGLSHWQHPSFFGYFPSNAPLSSVLGDFLSTGLGVLGLSWQASPALTELEEVVADWMRQMVGLLGHLERRDPGHRLDQHAASP